MDKNEIMKVCSQNMEYFESIINGMSYQKGGILNSEMLLCVSIIRALNVRRIIESGRATGQSTKILGESFQNDDYKIYSVEYNKYSKDVKLSLKILKNYKNLNLLFGDSFKIIPELITEDCCILIDGPKRLGAIKLALKLLNYKFVKAIFIHDLYKDSPHRLGVEKVFPKAFFSDDKEFVRAFNYLDKPCWKAISNHKDTRDWGPYRRGTKRMRSYGPTLMVVLNNEKAFNLENFKFHQKNASEEYRTWSLKFLIDGWPKRIRKIIEFPNLYIFYEKRVNKKKNIQLSKFVRIWYFLIYKELRSLFKKKKKFYN